MTQSPYKSAQDAAGKDRMKRYSEEDLSSTQYFKVKPDQESGTRKVLSIVYEALTKKGMIRSIRSSATLCRETPLILPTIWEREA